MNVSYLMTHLSYELHTCIRKYSLDCQLLETVCQRYGFQDIPFLSADTTQEFLHATPLQVPYLGSINNTLYCACVHTGENYFLIGPVKFSQPVSVKLSFHQPELPEEQLSMVPVCEFSLFIKQVLLLFNLFAETVYTDYQFISHNCLDKTVIDEIQKGFSDTVFENQELSVTHNPYDQEIREFSAIENGDIQQLKKSWEEDYTGSLGRLAKNELRNIKNLGIVVVALASRAAIRGGVLPEISFSLSDIYIQKIEELKNTEVILNLIHKCELHYTQLVQELKERQEGKKHAQDNPLIQLCKDYIFSHLHDKIEIQEIAALLHVNPNYLSECFKHYEGITMKHFILREKINLTKNLLIYSPYTYIEIAVYLGFSSQSHLGKVFKKETGYTLRQYRKVYGVKKFQEP